MVFRITGGLTRPSDHDTPQTSTWAPPGAQVCRNFSA
jgi:hypothetical protein